VHGIVLMLKEVRARLFGQQVARHEG
jgi:hypothetical protein